MTHTLPQKKTFSHVDVVGNDFHKVSEETQQRAVKKTVDPDRDLVQEALFRELVREQISTKWIIYTQTPGEVDIDTSVPRVKFESSGGITLKEVFQFMQFYPVLYGEESRPTLFEIPIGGEFQKFKLQNKVDGTFSLTQVATDGKETNIDNSRLNTAVTELSDPMLDSKLTDTLKEVMVTAADSKLKDQPDFEEELKTRDPNNEVSTGDKEKAFRAAVDVMTASFILGKDLAGSNPAMWLQDVKASLDDDITEMETDLSTEIKDNEKTKLNFEVTASFLESKTNAIDEWNKLKSDGIITETECGSGKNKHLEVTVAASNKLTLKTLFKLLQFYPDIYEDQKFKQTRFEVPIGGEPVKFRLSTSNPRRGGRHQIFVQTSDANFKDSTKRGGRNGLWGPDYDVMVDDVLKHFPDHQKLAETILESIDNTLDKQPKFSDKLSINDPRNPTNTADTIRASVEFMVISMIAEAAQPADEFKTAFLKDLATKIRKKNRFLESKDFPKLKDVSPLTGRSPTMDEIVRKGLEDVTRGKNFHDAFSTTDFPTRNKRGGTAEGRRLLHEKGNEDVATYVSRKRAVIEHDQGTLSKRIKLECTGTKLRKKRAACSLEDRDAVTVAKSLSSLKKKT